MSLPLALASADYLALPRAQESWLVQSVVPVGGSVLIYGAEKMGKAIDVTTPIQTPHGWRPMSEISVGDEVYAPDGTPTKVTLTSPVYTDHPCFRVTFSDGTHIVADAAHQWEVCETTGHGTKHAPKTLTTHQLYQIGPRDRGWLRWSVRVTDPIQFPSLTAALPLDPYCLGAWLGDGTSSAGAITTADAGVLDEWVKAGWQPTKQPSQQYGWHLKGSQKGELIAKLRQLGVLNDKHIPNEYLRASTQERTALLQGLMDTDGSCSKGTGTFWNMNERLARNVYDLAVGLGCKVKWHQKNAQLHGRIVGICYYVTIRASFNIFRLARKAEQFKLTRNHSYRIMEIIPTPSIPVKCIAVDHASHLYLAGRSCIVTHNTYAGLQLALAVATGDDWLGFRTRQTGRVMYVQLDTPANLWANDPEQYLKRLELMGILPNPNLFLADRETLDCWPFNILDTGHAGRLRAAVESVQPLMVVIDTLREAHRGDENASDDMQGAISGLVAACRPAAVLLVHHSKKPNHEQGRDTRSDMRGGYIAGRMDTVFQLGKGQLHFFGRALEDGSMKIDRQESGLWLPVHDGIEESIRGIFGADPTLPIREAARRLAASTGRSEDACRGLIRRHRPQEVEVG